MGLSREDAMEALTGGVRRGIVDLGSSYGRFDIPHELLYDAVREGVRQAMWQLMTNATDMPCADFFSAVEAGVKAAFEGLVFGDQITNAIADGTREALSNRG